VSRRVIDHTISGRAIFIVRATTRLTDATTRTTMAANDRRGVRSPEPSRERAAETTSAQTRPTTASAELTREMIRPTRESPRAAGCGRAKGWTYVTRE
jgi:hypothetical protein